jgi:hypothetical protein
MEILCGFGLSLPPGQDGNRAMSHKVFLNPNMRRWSRLYEENQADEAGDIWPEVSSKYSPDDLLANPENSQRRVLSEAFLILALAGLVAIAANLLIPALS